jgi:hypothetical protein
MTIKDELEARALFEQRYGITAAPLLGEIERRVIGGDWGANGYTTIAQAGLLRRTLVFARRKASALSGRAVELPGGRRPGPGGPARGPDRGRAGRHPARR